MLYVDLLFLMNAVETKWQQLSSDEGDWHHWHLFIPSPQALIQLQNLIEALYLTTQFPRCSSIACILTMLFSVCSQGLVQYSSLLIQYFSIISLVSVPKTSPVSGAGACRYRTRCLWNSECPANGNQPSPGHEATNVADGTDTHTESQGNHIYGSSVQFQEWCQIS
jgi:hypothetical protein